VRSVVVVVRQVSASPETWDWTLDWFDERHNTRQRSSGSEASYDVAVARASSEYLTLRAAS
jgi:hypothetical protein